MTEDTIRSIPETPLGVPPEPGRDEAFELELARLPRNDTGNAERFIRRRGHDFLWVKDAGCYGWDGKRWDFQHGERLATIAAQEVAAAIARHEGDALEREAERAERAGAEAREDADEFKRRIAALYERAQKHRGFGVQSGNGGRLSAMIEQAAPHLTIDQRELDAEPFLLNVQNGTLELGPAGANDTPAEIRLRGHDRRDRLTRICNVEYLPEAPKPAQLLATLKFFLPSKPVRRFLQRYFGYGLTGAIGEKCLLMLHGEGDNAKSTLVDAFAWVIGDHSQRLPMGSLMDSDRKDGGAATPDLARLPGARLVSASETKPGMVLDDAMVKRLTSAAPLPVRHLNRGFFDLEPRFKLVLDFNRRPTIRGDDQAIWNRVHLVHFAVAIARKDIDPDFLEKKLKPEGAGILNWLLEGYRMWRAEGLSPPDEVVAATEGYRTESDWLGEFLDAVCLTGAALETATGKPAEQHSEAFRDLYDAYAAWCFANRREKRGETAFGRRLSERPGVSRVKSGMVRYHGIRIEDRSWLDPAKAAPGKTAPAKEDA